MRRFPATMRRTLAGLSLVLVAAACSGGGAPGDTGGAAESGAAPAGATSTDVQLLDDGEFTGAVVDAIKRETKLQAEPVVSLRARVVEGSSWVELALDSAFSEYRHDPAKLDGLERQLAAEAKERLARGVSTLGFDDVRVYLRPLLKGVVTLRKLDGVASRPFAKGIWTVYAVQQPDFFALVTETDLARWGTTNATLDRIALANLRRETAADQPLICEEELCGWASGDGYDAARLAVPALRAEIVAEIGPAAFAVPTEDVYVAVPVSVAQRIGPKVLEQFTTGERPVSPDVFVEQGGKLVPVAGP